MDTLTLTGGRGRLRIDAALSIRRIDRRKAGRLPIASALRTNAEQRALIYRYFTLHDYRGFAFPPKRNPPYPHATGLYIDTPAINWMLTWGKAHGWRRDVPGDNVHFGYYPHLDKKKPKTLTIGSHGYRVQTLQTKLGILIDGKYGPQTRDAVHQWQKTHNLPATGQVGQITWYRLGL